MIIYLKRLKSSKFVRVKAFPMYGGVGVSAPSLHRESTDSLIQVTVTHHACTTIQLCRTCIQRVIHVHVLDTLVRLQMRNQRKSETGLECN